MSMSIVQKKWCRGVQSNKQALVIYTYMCALCACVMFVCVHASNPNILQEITL